VACPALDISRLPFAQYFEPGCRLQCNPTTSYVKTNPKSDLSGSFANTIHSNVLSLIEKYNPGNINYNFGACGGSLIKTSSLKEVIKNTDDKLLEEIIRNDKRISNCDYLLTVLFSIFGYIYLENIDFIEANRNQNWELTNHSIVHQYHKYYIENYDGKYKKS
jgi:hypothetical protein